MAWKFELSPGHPIHRNDGDVLHAPLPTGRALFSQTNQPALDSKRAQIVMDLLRKLAIEQNAAIIAVTHDDKIFDRFDRIFQLRDRRLEGSGHAN